MTVTAQKDLSTAASYSDAAMSLGLAFGPGSLFTQILSKYEYAQLGKTILHNFDHDQ